jgi:hypothetical protein
MANPVDIETLFTLLYPDIEVLYANPQTIDLTAMEQIPQWQGVKALLLTVEHKVLQGVRVNYPLAQPINENFVLQTLIDVPAVTS